METLTNLLADLRARGVTFVLDGERLKIRPWRELTADEVVTVQANRPALKQLIRDEATNETEATEATPAPQPETVDVVQEHSQAVTAMKTLGPEHWESVGVFRINGIPSHRLGDAHAAAILSGAIPLQTALEEERLEQNALLVMMLTRGW
jgi:hypothetical protein